MAALAIGHTYCLLEHTYVLLLRHCVSSSYRTYLWQLLRHTYYYTRPFSDPALLQRSCSTSASVTTAGKTDTYITSFAYKGDILFGQGQHLVGASQGSQYPLKHFYHDLLP